jgi:hypothetical protein
MTARATPLDMGSNRQAEAVWLSDLSSIIRTSIWLVLPNDTVQPQDSHPGH